MADEDIPKANIIRIAKSVLPPGVAVSQESGNALGRAAKMFILFLTACANDLCMKSDRTTINGNDILGALKEAEFDHLIPALTEVLAAYKSEQAAKRKKAKLAKSEQSGGDGLPEAAGLDKKKKADEDEVDVDDDAADEIVDDDE